MVLPLLFALVFAGVGVYLLVSGVRQLRPVYHILRDDPRSIRSLDGYTGPVEITGTAVAGDDGTVTAPFTGSECLAYTYEVQELRSSGKNSHWKTLDAGQDGVDFVVDDGTDRVRVDPTGADVHLGEHTVTVPPGTELPDRLARYVAATEAVEAQDRTVNLLVTELSVGNEQRFIERRLDVGERAYVYGAARQGPAPEWGSNLVDAVVDAGESTPVFVISDTTERGTAWRIAREGLVRAAFGLVFTVVPLAFLGPLVF